MTYRQGDPSPQGSDAPTHHQRRRSAYHGPAQGPGRPVKGQCVQGPWDAAAGSRTLPLDGGASVGSDHHGPPGNPSASQRGAGAPRTPQQPAERASDLQRRALTTPSSKPLGVSTRPRRSTGRCGWTAWLQSTKRPADGKVVWRRCQARGCHHCGPELRERNLAHDLANMAGKTITRRLVARSAWPAVREKIKRAGGLRTCYPQPDKMLAVYATAGLTGAVVAADDLAAYLASDYARIPGKEAIRRSSAWALNPKGAGEKAWRSLGTSEVTDQAPDILRGLGLYRGEVDEGAVPVEAWEVHNFTVPLATSEFDRFVYAVGLRKRRREAAA